jgi:hypothetical protein
MNFFNKKINKDKINSNDSFINPKILEVNLVKDEVGVEFNWSRHMMSLTITVLIAIALVAEVYYGLNWWQKQEEERTLLINQEHDLVTSDIKKINNNAKDYIEFKDKLTLTQKMADTHIYWTNFFDWIEKNTLNSVSYSGFSGDTSGEYSLSAKTNNFSDISWQVKNFKDSDMVELISVDSGNSSRSETSEENMEGAVSFSLTLKVKQQLFFKPAK